MYRLPPRRLSWQQQIQIMFSQEFLKIVPLCHPVNSFQWTGAGFNHNFFPLVQGHSALKCTDCHTTGNYSDANPDCYSCHQQDYNQLQIQTTSIRFSVTCENCHTPNPDGNLQVLIIVISLLHLDILHWNVLIAIRWKLYFNSNRLFHAIKMIIIILLIRIIRLWISLFLYSVSYHQSRLETGIIYPA